MRYFLLLFSCLVLLAVSENCPLQEAQWSQIYSGILPHQYRLCKCCKVLIPGIFSDPVLKVIIN